MATTLNGATTSETMSRASEPIVNTTAGGGKGRVHVVGWRQRYLTSSPRPPPPPPASGRGGEAIAQ